MHTWIKGVLSHQFFLWDLLRKGKEAIKKYGFRTFLSFFRQITQSKSELTRNSNPFFSFSYQIPQSKVATFPVPLDSENGCDEKAKRTNQKTQVFAHLSPFFTKSLNPTTDLEIWFKFNSFVAIQISGNHSTQSDSRRYMVSEVSPFLRGNFRWSRSQLLCNYHNLSEELQTKEEREGLKSGDASSRGLSADEIWFWDLDTRVGCRSKP